MHYVYRLQSISYPKRTYIGSTSDLKKRLHSHNQRCCDYTKAFVPWKLSFYAAFQQKEDAIRFEKYLKTGSGMAFGSKRLW